MDESRPQRITTENVAEFYNIDILREPQTNEEYSRVAQAKSLLVGGSLRDDEREYWKGIIQHGGQEYPPYEPQLQPKPQTKIR